MAPQAVVPQNFYIIEKNHDAAADERHVTLRSSSHPITLRTPLASDVPGLMQLMADPRNTGSDGSVSEMSREDLEKLVTKWTRLNHPLDHFSLAIIRDGQVIGISGFGLVRSDPQSQTLTGIVGVMLTSSCRGQGLAREAVRISIDFGFRTLGFRKIVLGTSSANVPMRKLMEIGLGRPATVETPDKFGNDLSWEIDPGDWLSHPPSPAE